MRRCICVLDPVFVVDLTHCFVCGFLSLFRISCLWNLYLLFSVSCVACVVLLHLFLFVVWRLAADWCLVFVLLLLATSTYYCFTFSLLLLLLCGVNEDLMSHWFIDWSRFAHKKLRLVFVFDIYTQHTHVHSHLLRLILCSLYHCSVRFALLRQYYSMVPFCSLDLLLHSSVHYSVYCCKDLVFWSGLRGCLSFFQLTFVIKHIVVQLLIQSTMPVASDCVTVAWEKGVQYVVSSY